MNWPLLHEGQFKKNKKKIQEEVKPVKKVENNFVGYEISQGLQNFATLAKLQGCCASTTFLCFVLPLSDI